ncbi:MAG: hypothetical protein M1820_006118 [Bogoriella megaspora]|nr:MAG: hypothetical protein M1820_006118 [Bogoriella megaspora]
MLYLQILRPLVLFSTLLSSLIDAAPNGGNLLTSLYTIDLKKSKEGGCASHQKELGTSLETAADAVRKSVADYAFIKHPAPQDRAGQIRWNRVRGLLELVTPIKISREKGWGGLEGNDLRRATQFEAKLEVYKNHVDGKGAKKRQLCAAKNEEIPGYYHGVEPILDGVSAIPCKGGTFAITGSEHYQISWCYELIEKRAFPWEFEKVDTGTGTNIDTLSRTWYGIWLHEWGHLLLKLDDPFAYDASCRRTEERLYGITNIQYLNKCSADEFLHVPEVFAYFMMPSVFPEWDYSTIFPMKADQTYKAPGGQGIRQEPQRPANVNPQGRISPIGGPGPAAPEPERTQPDQPIYYMMNLATPEHRYILDYLPFLQPLEVVQRSGESSYCKAYDERIHVVDGNKVFFVQGKFKDHKKRSKRMIYVREWQRHHIRDKYVVYDKGGTQRNC